MTAVEIPRVRLGRNWLRIGDRARVTPRRPGGGDGYDGWVTRLLAYPDGHVEVEVAGGSGCPRVFVLDRIRRRVHTRGGRRLDRGGHR